MGDFTSRDFKHPKHLEFYKLLRDVSPSGAEPFYKIFEDFLTLAHASLYQGVHKLLTGQLHAEREKEYLRVIGKYKPEKAKHFAMAMSLLIEFLDDEIALLRSDKKRATDHGLDLLGDVFHATGVGNHWNGQFFTPWNVCAMMSKMLVGDPKPDPNHRFTVQEPACGSGRMLLAMAADLFQADFRPWHWWFQAIDNDVRCAHMAYVQLTLAGCPGTVHHANSLTLEQWDAWPTLTGAMFPKLPEPDEPELGKVHPQPQPTQQEDRESSPKISEQLELF